LAQNKRWTAFLHFDVRPQKDARGPFHLQLPLTNAKSTVSDRHADHRRWLVVAASLDAFGVARFVDEKTTVNRIDRYNEVRNVQAAREFAAPVNKAITGGHASIAAINSFSMDDAPPTSWQYSSNIRGCTGHNEKAALKAAFLVTNLGSN
jgi:hypothetical protein